MVGRDGDVAAAFAGVVEAVGVGVVPNCADDKSVVVVGIKGLRNGVVDCDHVGSDGQILIGLGNECDARVGHLPHHQGGAMGAPILHAAVTIAPIHIECGMGVERVIGISKDAAPPGGNVETFVGDAVELAVVVLVVYGNEIGAMVAGGPIKAGVESGRRGIGAGPGRQLRHQHFAVDGIELQRLLGCFITQMGQPNPFGAGALARAIHQPHHLLFLAAWMSAIGGFVKRPFGGRRVFGVGPRMWRRATVRS